jgi:peptidyl-tRNA hydrolase
MNAVPVRTPEEIAADPRVMYIVVRNDLKLNAGKVGASCGHAVQMLMQWLAFIETDHGAAGPGPLPKKTAEDRERAAETRLWLLEDAPRYAKIILGADADEFMKVQLENEGFLVVDRGFTMVAPNTETAFGLYPMKKSEARGIIRTLKPLR